MSDQAALPEARATAQPTSLYSYYVVALLTIGYVFNFIDRKIVAIASPALKADLGLSDGELGLLKGFAFALLYTVAGIPIARWADRSSRVRIVSIAVVVWSFFTVISGLAQNFWQMLAARVGVGVGEAGGSPPSHSIIADYFPKEKRATALGIYSLGVPIGIMFAYLAGGFIVQYFGWRWAFFAVGAPGVLLGLLIYLTVREPERGAMDSAADRKAAAEAKRAGAGVTIRDAATHLFSIPTYAYACAGITLASFSGYAASFWIVDFFVRVHPQLPFGTLILAFGLISGIGFGLGTFMGGYLTERAAQKDLRNYMLFPAVGIGLSAPLWLLQFLATDPWMAMCYGLILQITLGFYLAPTFAMAQTLAPITMRALSTAILFFVLNLIALGFGPTFVGWASDWFTADCIRAAASAGAASAQCLAEAKAAGADGGTALRWALILSGLPLILASLSYWRASFFIKEDWRKATGGH